MHALLHLLTNRHFARQIPARDAATTRGILILAALCSGEHSAYHIVSPCSLAELGRFARVGGLDGIWLENGDVDGWRLGFHAHNKVGWCWQNQSLASSRVRITYHTRQSEI